MMMVDSMPEQAQSDLPLWRQQESLWQLAQKSAVRQRVPDDDPQPVGTWGGGQAVRLGNRQLKVSHWGPPDQLTWSIGKTDIWDRRHFPEEPITLEGIRRRCFDPDYDANPYSNQNPFYLSYKAYDFPCPKPAGQLILRCPALSGAPLAEAEIRHRDGGVTTTVEAAAARATVESLVTMPRNLILLRGHFEGVAGPVQLRVYRHRDTLRPGVSWMTAGGPEPQPTPGYDYSRDEPWNGPLDPPTAHCDGRLFWIEQALPGSETLPDGFRYVLMCLAVQGATAGPVELTEGEVDLGTPPRFSAEAHGGEADQERDELPFHVILPWYEPIRTATGSAATTTLIGDEIAILSTIVTSIDATDPVAAAQACLLQAENDGCEALVAENEEWWRAHYERREAGRIYHASADRNRAEVEATFGSWTSHHTGGTCPDVSRWEGDAGYAYMEQDWAPWHADNHFNEAEYTATFVRNQVDRLQMWYDIGEHVLPLARVNAREVYGCRGGMCALIHLPVRSRSVVHSNVVWEQGMEMMAQLARLYWMRYDFTGDREFLAEQAYPVLRDGAEFYADYLTPDEDGVYHVVPTVSQEHWGLTRDFSHNRDSIGALCMIKWHLETTARAAQTLNVDAERVSEWRRLAGNLAAYPTFETDDGPIFVDVPGVEPIEYNLVPVVYPAVMADEITLDSPPGLLAIMERTVRHASGWGHLTTAETIICRDPGIGAENLLNCRSGVIHLFPAVDAGADIGFRSFLAKGAFLVSAECVAGEVSPVLVRSLAGNDLLVADPWPGRRVVVDDVASGESLEATRDGRDSMLRIPTQEGHLYRLAPGGSQQGTR